MPVRPKEAATVILLRRCSPEDGGFEVLMVLRHPKSRFVPRAYVFPGGILDDEDTSAAMEERIEGIDRDGAFRILEDCPSPEIALGSWVAGIRETFEEVGILLAYEAPGRWLVPGEGPAQERLCRKRRLLFEGKLSFSRFLREERLTLACDRLLYYSHWITPELLPLRYDVRFFVAEAPPGQRAFHDGVELTRHIWIRPEKALSRFREGAFDMVLPTLATMKELASRKTVDEVLAWAGKKTVQGILTRMEKTDEGIVEYMPDGTAFRNLPPSVVEDSSRKEN